MIEYKSGNILKEDSEALINTVNCVGVMGCGIALQFKKPYPDNFKAYALSCVNDSRFNLNNFSRIQEENLHLNPFI